MTLDSILRKISAGVTVICGLSLTDLETRGEAMALLRITRRGRSMECIHILSPCRNLIFSIRQYTIGCEFISLCLVGLRLAVWTGDTCSLGFTEIRQCRKVELTFLE